MTKEKNKIKYDYSEGFCKPSGYYCSMPIEYEWNGKEYHKTKMVCGFVKEGNCSRQQDCDNFKNAPGVADREWTLKDKLY